MANKAERRSLQQRKQAAALALQADLGQVQRYPWYDSVWLEKYDRAMQFLDEKHPDKVAELESLVEVFQTSPSFDTCMVPALLEPDVLAAVRDEVARVVAAPVSTYERENFGRDLLHDRPFFTALQHDLTDRVSQLVGEPVAPCYNFLSLYGPEGVCAPHMDTPQAKWTVDICIDQSVAWPLHVSPVVPWPVDWVADPAADWQEEIRSSHTFSAHVLEPGDAVVFAGSSQWHYRDPMPATSDADHCHLLFLHYLPADAHEHVEPTNWPRLLNVAALGKILASYPEADQSAKGMHRSG